MSTIVQPTDLLTLQPKESTSCSKSVIATASLAVISVVVFGLLAILVNAHVITLPSQLSVSTLLIVGGVGCVIFGIISIALRYCPSSTPPSSNSQTSQEPSADHPSTGGPSNPLTPDGSGGRTGAPRSGGSSTTSFNVKKEQKKDLLL